MRYLIILLLSIVASDMLSAANISLDKEWYVAGEEIVVDIDLSDKESRVAYVELSDEKAVQAGTLAKVQEGRGQVVLLLPTTLHSGYYRLAVYTRLSAPLCIDVPVVNTLHSTANDKIEWHDGATKTKADDSQNIGVYTLKKKEMTDVTNMETAGHTVVARLKQPQKNVSSMLSVVGKQVNVFSGKQINDSTLLFYTYGLTGKHQVVVSAYDEEKHAIPVEIVSPYTAYLPETLPVLHLNYSRSEVEERSINMQRMALELADTTVALPYKQSVFGTEPVIHYDLDEYRQFATIGDTFVEYVNFVHQSDKNGLPELFVFNEPEGYSSWAALVLIDGMPTNEINRLLKYDARRIKNINIYNEWFTLGTNCIFKGIVSFVTRSGNITNFPPDKGSAYIVYDFPK